MDKKVWAKGVLAEFGSILNNSWDTTPERINANRNRFLPRMMERAELKSLGANDEALDLIWEWYHYFDEGYQSKYTIDELPELIKKSLLKMGE